MFDLLKPTDNATTCEIYIETYEDPSMNFWVVLVFTTIYSTLFILGTIGNLSVIFLTARNSKLQTVQNLFILNLAASDLFMCVFSLPLTPVTNVYKNWFFGREMCHSLPWIQGITVFIATFSLAAIAIDRYFLVLTPHSPVRKPHAKIIMMVLWFLATFFTLPYSMFMDQSEVEGLCGYFCTETWPNDDLRRSYTVFVLMVQFVVPFAIMFFCYYKIFDQLRQRTKAKIKKFNERSLILVASAGIMSAVGHTIQSNDILAQQKPPKEEPLLRRKSELVAKTRRNTILLLSMVLMFGFAWLPHNAVSMMIEFSDDIAVDSNGTNWIYLINLITHSIAMLTIVANPILYGLLNPEFVSILKKTCSDWKLNIQRNHSRSLMAQSSNSTFV